MTSIRKRRHLVTYRIRRKLERMMQAPTEYNCHLVQRLWLRDTDNPKGKGVDKFTSFDYMGSSEFEWGALPAALKQMRGSNKLFLQESFHDPKILVLGEPWAVDAFEHLRLLPANRFKENCEFPWGNRTNTRGDLRPNNSQTTGWWFLNPTKKGSWVELTPFLAFSDDELALLWEEELCREPT